MLATEAMLDREVQRARLQHRTAAAFIDLGREQQMLGRSG
jgi:hypothetical protein